MSPIANMLIQIKNAQLRGLDRVVTPSSRMKRSIVNVLKQEGYISAVDDIKKKGKKVELPYLSLTLKPGAINGVRFISVPSRRRYSGKDGMKKVKDGYGIAVVSTSKGIMTSVEAHKVGLGGEMLFEIW